MSVAAALIPLAILALNPSARGQTNAADSSSSSGPFVGQASCSSSGCHGGAGEKRNTCIQFNKLDFHTRSYATLTLARSAGIAANLDISDPAQSARCTVCHAPFQTLAVSALEKALDPVAGVSCESCHGPARNWLLSHTRPDYTHQDRVHAGMRDLDSLYARANTCVACHQNVDPDLLQAGHPELIFELDGQSVTEPKHWREKPGWSGPQTWLVGQAVALREMSWQLAGESSPSTNALNRQAALAWLLQTALKGGDASAALTAEQVQHWSDQLARDTASAAWSATDTTKNLDLLAGTAADFRDTAVSRAEQGRRAERLVLALDRLVEGLDDAAAAKRLDAPLAQLFKDSQSLPDFDPQIFAGHLEVFQKALTGT